MICLRSFASITILLLLLTALFSLVYGNGPERCSLLVKNWAEKSLQDLEELPENHGRELQELLYFLHVPRTGGRTYHQCLLRHLYPPEQLCDRSYDKLRFNSSKHCRLLVTHDDYSILSKLPPVSTSVVTNMRHPVDRIFSAYEFSVEVASRFLKRSRRKPLAASTLSIWPWSLLVPWMREDIFARESSRQLEGTQMVPDILSYYNASSYAMPLHEFVYQPIVIDTLHNGATFQVAGVTNNSYMKGAKMLRKCVIEYPSLGSHVLRVAKKRMDKMIFVGLTDKHGESAKLFAHIVGGQMLPLGEPLNDSATVASQEGSEENQHLKTHSTNIAVGEPKEASKTNLTVYGLIDKYNRCANRLWETQVQRRSLSLKGALPINFSSEARSHVSEEILELIKKMNSLDMELYHHAEEIFSNYIETTNTSKKAASASIVLQPEELKIFQGEIRISDVSHPWWFGSGKAIWLVLLSTSGVLVSVGILFLNGGRKLRFQRFQGHNVHIKL